MPSRRRTVSRTAGTLLRSLWPVVAVPLAVLLAGPLAVLPAAASGASETVDVDFVRDIRPIFEEHCYECHGPDKREGGLRLTNRRDAFVPGDLGLPAIEPSSPELSPLYELITSDDPDERMPQEADPLSPAQIETIRRWIDTGAVWPEEEAAPHWAYQRPVRPPVPTTNAPRGGGNEIDSFIDAKLDEVGLAASPEADRVSLLRRLSFDLTGLPPTLEEIDAFLADDSPRAYEALVDRLLARPQFGEHWASSWLDRARHADSLGFQPDRLFGNWPYRDWVIEAINGDMPFDQFTIEQLAGDMLPNATNEQRIATGFHRAAPLNLEAGIHEEESRVQQVFDRVNVTSTVWLGSTIECAQCHNHKYDAFSQDEYYRLFAFFNNTPIESKAFAAASFLPDGPAVAVDPSPEVLQERIALLESMSEALDHAGALRDADDPKLAQHRKAYLETVRERAVVEAWFVAKRLLLESTTPTADEFDVWRSEMRSAVERGEPQWQPLQVVSFEGTGNEGHTVLRDGSVLVHGPLPDTTTYTVRAKTDLAGITTLRLQVLPHETLPGGGPGRGDEEQPDFILAELTVVEEAPGLDDEPVLLHSATQRRGTKLGPARDALDENPDTGWTIEAPFGRSEWASFATEEPVGTEGESTTLRFTMVQNAGFGRNIGRFRLLATNSDPDLALLTPGLVRQLTKAPDRPAPQAPLRTYFRKRSVDPTAAKVLRAARRRLGPLANVAAPVMAETAPRETHVLKRGDYLDPGAKVSAGTPAILHPMAADLPRDRLGLARWLVDPANPLVARVVVNRWWSQLFGRGLVATPEDFGSQGDLPTHPKLLDWLAVEFVESGWSRKKMLRTIVTSAAYRRQSVPADETVVPRDPENLLLARSNRLRLPAESIRDNALAISGLLSSKRGGPPVYPPQPDGVWRLTGGKQPIYRVTAGEDRYRRGIYTVRRRSAPYPSFANFDAGDRASCVVQRGRTNTPLQALTLLNDEVYVEAALALAMRIVKEQPAATDEERVRHAFRLATARTPTASETAVLLGLHEWQREEIAQDSTIAPAIIGSFHLPESLDPKEVAAWFLVSSAILNLDETITRG